MRPVPVPLQDCPSARRGFTLIELLMTLAILAALAGLVVPLAEVQLQRSKEHELRIALRDIRQALDAHKRAVDDGRIALPPGASGYPASLEVLVTGVVDQREATGRRIYFLRRIPRNPLAPDATVADVDTWARRAYSSEPGDGRTGDDVYDVFAPTTQPGLNGVPYERW